jgi:isopenicillin N synthase-like dioxygenase
VDARIDLTDAMASSLPVPAIDLDRTSPSELVAHLRNHSCVVVTAGHGIPDAMWRSMIDTSRTFFALDADVKEAVRWGGEGPWLGYLPMGSTEPAGTTTPKLLERFEVQMPNPWTGDRGDLDGRARQFALWPTAPAGFTEIWVRMYDVLGQLAERVMSMIIDGLDLPEDQRAAWTTNHFANLVVNNYFAQESPPLDGQTRLLGHVDIGGVTLLSADEAPGGLEVQVDGEWVPVVLPPNAYLVQVGDLLRRWTNNVIPGNLHRVVNPPPELASQAQRLSLVYFHYPAPDTVVEPAASCIGEQPVDREAMHSHEHMMYRQRRELYEADYSDEFV